MQINLSLVKNRMVRRFGIYIGALVVTFAIYFVIDLQKTSIEDASHVLENDITVLNNRITELGVKLTQLEESIILWEQLSTAQKSGKGLRIAEAREVLRTLQQYNNLSEMKVNLTKPEDVLTATPPHTTMVEMSKVTIEFTSLSDEHALSFLNMLNKNFPGYIAIQSLQMTKTAPIDEKALISVRQGQFPSLVKTSVMFTWKDLKSLALKTPAPGEAPAPAGTAIPNKAN